MFLLQYFNCLSYFYHKLFYLVNVSMPCFFLQEEALDAFVNPETLEGNNQVRREKYLTTTNKHF